MFGRRTRALEAIAAELRRANELAEKRHSAELAGLQLRLKTCKAADRAAKSLETIQRKLAESAAAAEQARDASASITGAIAPLLERLLEPRAPRVVISEGDAG